MPGVTIVHAPHAALALGGQRAQFRGRAGRARSLAASRPARVGDHCVVVARRRFAGAVRASIQEPETAESAVPDTWTEDDLDKIQFAMDPDQAAISNKEGAGATMAAPIGSPSSTACGAASPRSPSPTPRWRTSPAFSAAASSSPSSSG